MLRYILRVGLDVFFFFSSRRRHTRFDCDWSSDVCSSDLVRGRHVTHDVVPDGGVVPGVIRAGGQHAAERRSEEHTSELQSQSNLVCRLLLEKKKIIIMGKLLPQGGKDICAEGRHSRLWARCGLWAKA